ncbi:MAG: outer membrane porin, OprD family [Campylobacterales bacterium]|nr:outer membrane porin, OprD family [Campylobacterales bacterium]
MKKILSLATVLACGVSNSFGADSVESAFKEGKASGEVRAFYINRDWTPNVASRPDRAAFAVGGNLGFDTAPVNGLSAGAKFYTTQGVGLNSDNGAKIDPTLFDDNKDSYSILGEAYMAYKNSQTTVKVGRQKLDTPLAGSDDARMLPNLFEAAVIANTDIKDTTLILAHVSKFAAGTFSNAYANSGVDANGINSGGYLALHGGYGLNNQSGKFMNMGGYAVGKDTNGVTAGAVIYKGIPNLTLQLWDYYATDILNAIYAEAEYKWNCLINPDLKMALSGQYIGESDVGDKFAGQIDSDYYGVQLSATVADLNLKAAYSETGESKGKTTNGGIISPWGGMPAYTQGMVTRHQFFADTEAWKVSGTYNFKKAIGEDIALTLAYMEYKMGDGNMYQPNKEWTAKESLFDLMYTTQIKGLKLKLRGNFPTDFAPNLDWDEYRVIAYYNF